ncbi:MAG: hypothetical protein NTW03_22950 [Verrucomicrobia bacterium]|nr:hypothetical protein [Verrucomicrobiota bacterium]
MNRILIIINLALLITAGTMFWLMSGEAKNNRRLTMQLTQAAAQPPKALPVPALTNDPHQACREQISALSAALSNAAAELTTARQRLRELGVSTSPAAVSTSAVASVAAVAVLPSSGPVAGATNTGSLPPMPRLFETLYGTNHKVLARNVEFTGVYGRRVSFKDAASPSRMAFDVDQLDPSVLPQLGIDAASQKALQARYDQGWKKLEAAGQAFATAQEQQRQEQKAADEAARAEAEKQWAEQRQQMQQNQAMQPNQTAPSSSPPNPPPRFVPVPIAVPVPTRTR